MKRAIIILLAIVTQQSMAQIADDALILSRWQHEGTARVTAMGGAYTALGGDLSSATINPAGLGLYRGSDFSFSVAGLLNKTTGSYFEADLATHQYRMNMPTFGIALSSPNYNKLQSGDGPNSWTFGLGYNQIHTFNRAFGFEGTNNFNSYLDIGVPNPYDMYMDIFVDNDVIFDPDGDGNYTHDYLEDNYGTYQEAFITEKGGIGEYYLSFAANFMDDLYLGATFGIQSVYISRTFEFSETPTSPTNQLDYFDYYNSLKTSGLGLNLKLGLIYSPVYWFKFGAAIHTPTNYNLTDDYSEEIQSSVNGSVAYNSITPYIGDYDILTPTRILGGVSFLIKKRALISADYEFVDYSTAQLGADDYSFTQENRDIADFYKPTHSFRLGGEYKIAMLALRAGGFYYASPFNNDLINKDNYKLGYSLGLGFRSGSYYFDIAYSKTMENLKYSPYGLTTASIDSDMTKIIGTLGFRF
ncbi:MAG: hypothetical protein C0599_02350 [Salinivirgaceae bacterium]|nr:MAG: hypothetical protein C0599_02350 [Salinivirgaceae bacterium]